MQNISLSSAALALNGAVVSGAIVAPGPGHSMHDRSLSVRFSSGAPGGFVVHSFAGDDPIVCRDHVRERLGLKRDEMPVSLEERARTSTNDKGALARRIWQEAHHPSDTPVMTYLARRGVSLPFGAAGVAIRFHPACPFAGTKTAAMIALVTDIVTNNPLGIHRTALTMEGGKRDIGGTSRLSLGVCVGGAVKLSPDEGVSNCLGVGEGIETTLSLRRIPEFGLSPVWSLLSAGNLAACPVLPGIECLWIAEDHDPAGSKACEQLGVSWGRAGMEVFRVRAQATKADLNDIVRKARHG